MIGKRASILQEGIIDLIIMAVVALLFIFALHYNSDSRGLKQQVIEKELALLIDSGVPGMEFSIEKKTFNGIIQEIKLEGGKVHVSVDGFFSLKGYPYFSNYNVNVFEEEDKFVLRIL